MKMHLETGSGRNIIRGYRPGELTVNQDVYRASLVLLPGHIVADWPPRRFEDLAVQHFQLIADLRPEVALLGTGARLRFPAPALTRALTEAGIGLEVMDTAAACRTYNILMAEGRVVAAGLLLGEMR